LAALFTGNLAFTDDHVVAGGARREAHVHRVAVQEFEDVARGIDRLSQRVDFQRQQSIAAPGVRPGEAAP
jgi:hypothetical protein